MITISCNDTPYMQGKRLYEAKCQNCHMADGSGLAELIPSIKESKIIGTNAIACVIRKGLKDTIFQDTTFLVKEMPAFKKFSATEITNIVNYINHEWHQPFIESTIIDIQSVLKDCE